MRFSFANYDLRMIPASLLWLDTAAWLVVLLSVTIGLAMVVLFRYTSNQKAIHAAKEQIKGHLLAVRLFQDQLPVVLSSYGRIMRGTGRYLRLAFMPLLIVALPLTLLLVHLDRYFGWMPISPGQTFLIKARTSSEAALNEVGLELPPQIVSTAPPVHVPVDREIVWRLLAHENGDYQVNLGPPGQMVTKSVRVGPAITVISSLRQTGSFWKRWLHSAEPALPQSGAIQSVEVEYPERTIHFAWLDWNWIWMFFVLSLIAGFFFKSILGIEI